MGYATGTRPKDRPSIIRTKRSTRDDTSPHKWTSSRDVVITTSSSINIVDHHRSSSSIIIIDHHHQSSSIIIVVHRRCHVNRDALASLSIRVVQGSRSTEGRPTYSDTPYPGEDPHPTQGPRTQPRPGPPPRAPGARGRGPGSGGGSPGDPGRPPVPGPFLGPGQGSRERARNPRFGSKNGHFSTPFRYSFVHIGRFLAEIGHFPGFWTLPRTHPGDPHPGPPQARGPGVLENPEKVHILLGI